MNNTEALEAINRELAIAKAKSDYYAGYKDGLDLGKTIIKALIDSADDEAKSR